MHTSVKRTWAGLILLVIAVLLVGSCTVGPKSVFYDAGASDYTASGAEFVQNWLFRFDTSGAGRTFTTPSAIDILAVLTSPVASQVIVFGITAEGGNEVKLLGGANVTIKPSAAVISANSTLTIYMKLDNVNADSGAVTIY